MDDPEEVKEDELDDVYPGRVGRLCSIKPLSLPAYYSKTTTYIDTLAYYSHNYYRCPYICQQPKIVSIT